MTRRDDAAVAAAVGAVTGAAVTEVAMESQDALPRENEAAAAIDFGLVREFCDIADEHDLVGLEVGYGSFRLKLRRHADGPVCMAPPAAFAAPSSAIHSDAAGSAATRQPTTVAVPPGVVSVAAPLTGVFYRAVRPGGTPFVEVGDEVLAGQTLCIIEAMKLMNEIKADAAGRVVRILAENAQVVESGQEILFLEPTQSGT